MEVDKKLLGELEEMGFLKSQATKALESGYSSIEAAINWIVDHENDTTSNEIPMVLVNIAIEAIDSSHISEQVKLRAQRLRNPACTNKYLEGKKLGRETEKERIRAGKELFDAKRMVEESERTRFMAQRKVEKEEEKRAKEKILQKLQQDKLERSGILGLPKDDSKPMKPAAEILKKTTPSAAERETMRECLRCLKRQNKEDNAQALRAFQTLLIYVRNIFSNPDDGKFRKIRIRNPVFQDRVGKFDEGVKFLELCGFERVEGGLFLFLPAEKVDKRLLTFAGMELQSALENPFFGLLSE